MKRRKKIISVALCTLLFGGVASGLTLEDIKADYQLLHEAGIELYRPLVKDQYLFETENEQKRKSDYRFRQNYLTKVDDVNFIWSLEEEGVLTYGRSDRTPILFQGKMKPTWDIIAHDENQKVSITFSDEGDFSAAYNRKNHHYQSEIRYGKNQLNAVLVDGAVREVIGEEVGITFDQLLVNTDIQYDERLRRALKQESKVQLDNFILKIDPALYADNDPTNISEIGVGTLNVEGKQELYNANISGEINGDLLAVIADYYQLTADNFRYQYDFSTIDQLGSYKEQIALDGVAFLNNDEESQANFGSAEISSNIYNLGIENEAILVDFLKGVVALIHEGSIKGELEGDEFEALQVELYENLLREDSGIEYQIDLINSAGESNITIAAQLRKKIESVQELMDELDDAEDISVFLDYIDHFDLKVGADDQYIIELAMNIMTVAGEVYDYEAQRAELEEQIPLLLMMAIAFTPEGITLFEREVDRTLFSISYREGLWSINGRSYTTAQLGDLLENLL